MLNLSQNHLTSINCNSVNFDVIFDNVNVINNAKKRVSKNTEYYFECGGGYDTESTTVLDSDKTPLYAFVYHVQIMINGHYITTRYIDDITDFFINLSEYLRQKDNKAKLIIWVANLSHEWAFFKKQLAKTGDLKIFAKSKRQILKITICDNIELRECIGLFGVSLSDIAKNHTVTQKLKGDLDYTLYRTPETPLTESDNHYMYNDVKILDELSHKAFEIYTKKAQKIPLTKTGALRNKCKSKIKAMKWIYDQNEKLLPNNVDDYVKMRRFLYNGGLCGGNTFYNGKKLNNVICCDLTSDYPAQMLHNMFPSGELIELVKPSDIVNYSWHNYIIDVTFNHIESKSIHCSVSEEKIMNGKTIKHAVKNNGKILYAENVRLMLNEIDLKTLKLMYNLGDVKINRAWYFTHSSKIPKYLYDCITEDYQTKNELKKQGLTETLEYLLSKQNVNSYYGMCATRLYDCNYTYDINDTSMINETTGDAELDELIKKGLTNTKEYKRLKQMQYEKLKSHVWLNPYIAYWTTSFARNILCQFISKYPDLIIQYDTDSIYFCIDKNMCDVKRVEMLKKDIADYNNKILIKNTFLFKSNPNFKTLGQWDIGQPYKHFKTLGAKRYIYEKQDGSIKTVVAGLVKGTLQKQAAENNIDVFDFFTDEMTIATTNSEKLASVYNDDDIGLQPVTDYLGNTTNVYIGTYHALYNIEFTLMLAHDLSQLISAMEIEKALPYDNRVVTKAVNRILEVEKNEKHISG